MNQVRVAIIGGGLSGLYAAYGLECQGIADYVVLEARDRLGGRVLSVPPLPGHTTAMGMNDRFDLGPSWFWPEYQPQLDQLVKDLGLERFSQSEVGDALIERSSEAAPVRVGGYVTAPPSMRLTGGMQMLIEALVAQLDGRKLLKGMRVNQLDVQDRHVTLRAVDASGEICTWAAEQVLLALPPRLALHALTFSPGLPAQLVQQWQHTPTWMAPHAKYVAVYNARFWKPQGLSGQARSTVGPMVELHDASSPGGHGALFGFIGLPASARCRLSPLELKRLCRAQLVRLFGEQAGMPVSEHLQDWAQEPLTAVPADVLGQEHTSVLPRTTPETGPWQGRLIGIGSEWSAQYPGYLAGAIDAASQGIQALTQAASPLPLNTSL